ncbi:helix-turn-helix domain-containing protein [Candidatus Dependentiae bacterium]|nr:helix-turn-helix domain-containing protein [Candidatus Dependentiae bacterium]
MKKKIEYTQGSGNVFADIDFLDAQEMLAKAELTRQINAIIKKKRLTQSKAATLLCVDQPKILAIAQGKIVDFSLEKLFRCLTLLGQDITIVVTHKARSKRQANVIVRAAKTTQRPASKRSHGTVGAIQAKKKR